MSEIGVFAYCAAVGFVSAATISSFYRWVTSEQADFSIEQKSAARLALAVLINMFAGPFIVMEKVISGLRSQQIRALPAMIGTVVAGMWSVCAGMFYVSLLLSG